MKKWNRLQNQARSLQQRRWKKVGQMLEDNNELEQQTKKFQAINLF